MLPLLKHLLNVDGRGEAHAVIFGVALRETPKRRGDDHSMVICARLVEPVHHVSICIIGQWVRRDCYVD
jgi:hypothetical protein